MPPQIGKNWFFDSPAVLARVDAARRRSLSKAGAFVRQRARSLIRKRRAVSAPGSPPSSHEGALRRLLWFAYDPIGRSVVVGPVLYNAAKRRVRLGGQTVPALLEGGGRVAEKTRGGVRVLVYRPRPFMAPALALERAKFPGLFKDSVGG